MGSLATYRDAVGTAPPTRRSRLTRRPKWRDSNRPSVFSWHTLLAVCVPCAGWHLCLLPSRSLTQIPLHRVLQKMSRSLLLRYAHFLAFRLVPDRVAL